MAWADVGLIIVAVFLPPLAVFIKQNRLVDFHFCLNILLTLLGWIPGIIHAVYIILTRPAPTSRGATLPT